MARKISQDQLRRDIFKPLGEHELLSKEQFEKAFPLSEFEIYSISGLNKARVAIFKLCKANPDEETTILEKAKMDFATLKRINVLISDKDEKLQEVAFFVRSKLEKAMKGEELNIGGDDEKKNEAEKEKKRKNTSPALIKDKSKKNSDEDEDENNSDGDEDENEEVNNEGNEDEDENEDENENENGELSDEAFDVLAFIKEVLDEEGEVDEKEISEEEGLSDEETNALIEELVKKGYIKVEEDGHGYDITAITDEGTAFLEEQGGDENGQDENGQDENEDDQNQGDNNQDDNQDDNQQGDDEKVVVGKQDLLDAHKEMVDNLTNGKKKDSTDAGADENETGASAVEDEDKNVDDEDNQQGNGEDQQDDSGHKPGEDEKQGQAGDPAQLEAFAKQTPTDKLEEYVKDQSNPPASIQVAQAELDRRKKEGDSGPAGNGQGDEETPEEKAEKDEFDGWLGDYFDNHDITDLQALVKDLILASPSETKVLKDHYRNDYQATNKGNQALKIDAKEFEEWVLQYLEHQPQAHLKDYAKRLASQDPDALNKLKGKYKALKDNKIV